METELDRIFRRRGQPIRHKVSLILIPRPVPRTKKILGMVFHDDVRLQSYEVLACSTPDRMLFVQTLIGHVSTYPMLFSIHNE